MVVEGDAIGKALAFAREFTCYSLPVLQFARSAVSRALDVPVSEGLRIEAELSTLDYGMRDAEEGMAAFEAKEDRCSLMTERGVSLLVVLRPRLIPAFWRTSY
jgi:enoyl-CoA hydratase/carnithine racemase